MTDTASASAPVADDAVRCSAWARSVSLSPIGTAGSYAGYALVEVPLPWPRDVSEMAYLGPVSQWAAAAGYRVQALVPRPERGRRFVLHGPGGGPWYSGYSRRSVAADGATADDLLRLAQELASAPPAAPDPGCDARGGEVPVRDVLVCTHGRRDVCCGSAGTALALELLAGGGFDGTGGDATGDDGAGDEGAGDASSGRGAAVVVHRTSHTGGHRFAPTFLVLPEGTAWAFADPDLVRSVVGRTADFDSIADHYRGCAGLGGHRVQALEREVMRRVGWELLDRPRRGEPVGADSPTVRLQVQTGPDAIETWEADVLPGRTLPVPECMRPLSEARKSETEWAVSGLRRL